MDETETYLSSWHSRHERKDTAALERSVLYRSTIGETAVAVRSVAFDSSVTSIATVTDSTLVNASVTGGSSVKSSTVIGVEISGSAAVHSSRIVGTDPKVVGISGECRLWNCTIMFHPAVRPDGTEEYSEQPPGIHLDRLLDITGVSLVNPCIEHADHIHIEPFGYRHAVVAYRVPYGRSTGWRAVLDTEPADGIPESSLRYALRNLHQRITGEPPDFSGYGNDIVTMPATGPESTALDALNRIHYALNRRREAKQQS